MLELERLEARWVPAGLTVKYYTNFVGVHCTPGDDVVTLTQDDLDTFLVNGVRHSLAGRDRIDVFLGRGDDRLDASGMKMGVRAYGNGGHDLIIGSNHRDYLHGQGSDGDTVLGLAGNDLVYGSVGDDLLDGGDGQDVVSGSYGDDTLFGGSGNDLLHGMEGDDEIHGGDGDDYLNGFVGDDTLGGGAGDDSFHSAEVVID